MKNPEDSGGGREDQRKDRDAMWQDLKNIPFKRTWARVAELEEPKTYRMQIVPRFFSLMNQTKIDTPKWQHYFKDEQDKGANKDETEYNKVLQAVEAWNNASQESRKKFLETGEYSDEITGDMISLLTEQRIIGFADSEPGGGGGGGHGGGGGGHEGGHDGGDGHGGGHHGGDDGPRGGGPRGGEKPRGGDTHDGDGPGITPVPPYEGPKPHPEDEDTDEPKPENDDGDDKQPGDDIEQPIPEDPGNETKPDDPGDDKEKPEDPEDDPEDDPEEPEALEEEKETVFTIIKRFLKRELTDEEKEAIAEKVKKEKDKFLQRLAAGTAMVMIALMLFIPPVDTVQNPNNVSVSGEGTRVEQTYHPASEHERTLIEKLLQDTSLGDTVELPSGTVLHNSSDYELVRELGGNDPTVTIGESSLRAEGEYTLDRVSFLDEDGNIIDAYHIEDGDNGSIQDLLQQTRQNSGYEGKISISCHFDGPNGGGELSGQTGWSAGFGTEFGVDESQIPDTVIETEPAYTTEDTITYEYHGEGTDAANGQIEVTTSEGKTVTIDVMKPDGTYRSAGETVIGSDGNAYQIESIDIQDGGTSQKLNLLKLGHDLAMLGLAGTGIALALSGRRKREEGEPGGDGDTEATPEFVTERERMELNGEQLVRLTKIFSERAGDTSEEIAEEMAEKAGVTIPLDIDIATTTPEELEKYLTESRADGIFSDMTYPEELMARTLLAKHDEATLEDLSQRIGMDLEELADQILNGTPEWAENPEAEYEFIDTNENEEV